MPKLTVKKTCSMPPEDAFSKFSEILKNDTELKKLDAAYSCQFEASDLTGVATGKMFKAKMKVAKNSAGSEVEIEVELPFALSLIKGMVQNTLQKKLDKALA
jgi:hypothetical protein